MSESGQVLGQVLGRFEAQIHHTGAFRETSSCKVEVYQKVVHLMPREWASELKAGAFILGLRESHK